MPTFTPGDTVPPTGVIGSSANLNDDALGTDITPAGWPTTGKATAVEVELTATSQFTADGQVQVGVSRPGSLDPIPGLSDAGGTFSLADGEVEQFRSGDTDAFHFEKFGGWRWRRWCRRSQFGWPRRRWRTEHRWWRGWHWRLDRELWRLWRCDRQIPGVS